MDKDELIARLRRYEWNDVEFKQAQRGVPDTAYETVSAFSNSLPYTSTTHFEINT